ncbi:hypothetical protein NC651_011790 [Populus alba x Populus x berolinensis]|nr:hypothetical protein NC651_011790 [Populus alba x Populus x berolinensis]
MRMCPGYARSSTTVDHIWSSFPNSSALLFPIRLFSSASINLIGVFSVKSARELVHLYSRY